MNLDMQVNHSDTNATMPTNKDDKTSDPPRPHIGSHLQPLPQELMDIVLGCVEDVDILALRVTCRSVAGQAQDAFLNRYFSERRHLITEYSLRRLADICKDDVLSSRLKSIEFVHVELDEQWHLDLLDFDTTTAESLMGMYDHTRWLGWRAQHCGFVDRRARGIIVSALKMLKDKTVPSYPALKISGNARYPRPAYGLHELHLSLGIDPVANRKCGTYYDLLTEPLFGARKTTRLLLRSIGEAHFEVRDLTLCSGFMSVTFADLDIGIYNPGLHSALSRLRHLSIHFGWEIEKEDPEVFANFVTAATSLEHVSVEFSGAWPDVEPVPSAIVGAFKSSKLSSIDLAYAVFELSDLTALLLTQQGTLRRLRLVEIAPIDGNSWAPMLQTLQTEFDLEYIDIRLLTETGDKLGRAVHEGKAAVQEELRELIKQANVLP